MVYGAALGEKETQRIILYFNQLLGGLIGLDSHDLWRVVVGFAVLKCLIAMTLAAVGWRASVNEQDLLNHRLLKWGLQCLPSASTKNKMANPFSAALRELFRPLFLIPFVMTGVFLWFAEDSIGVFIRKLLQPIAFAYLILIVARMLPVDRWIKEKGWGGTALATALKFLSDKSQEKSSSVEKES
ncbi:MAG: hypothetical protein EB120_05875 [Proteobacteria bacterium]|nr:hypothetical protein [Pseudomonadota bacterium]